MRAMILAAGRGQRMGELTDKVPKPLLKVGQHFLIEYALFSLVKIGIKDVVINICYRGEQIKKALEDGSRYGIKIYYSEEESALETGGGILQALPLLGADPFIVLSCDVITDYPLQLLPQQPQGLAHLVMVDNPPYHRGGDFGLIENKLYLAEEPRLTFGNIGVYRPELFVNCKPGRFPLSDVLKPAIQQGQITGEYFQGAWHNLGSAGDLHKAFTQLFS